MRFKERINLSYETQIDCNVPVVVCRRLFRHNTALVPERLVWLGPLSLGGRICCRPLYRHGIDLDRNFGIADAIASRSGGEVYSASHDDIRDYTYG
jgi:hypothetical protein